MKNRKNVVSKAYRKCKSVKNTKTRKHNIERQQATDVFTYGGGKSGKFTFDPNLEPFCTKSPFENSV